MNITFADYEVNHSVSDSQHEATKTQAWVALRRSIEISQTLLAIELPACNFTLRLYTGSLMSQRVVGGSGPVTQATSRLYRPTNEI